VGAREVNGDREGEWWAMWVITPKGDKGRGNLTSNDKMNVSVNLLVGDKQRSNRHVYHRRVLASPPCPRETALGGT
jgi:hypothetical protein